MLTEKWRMPDFGPPIELPTKQQGDTVRDYLDRVPLDESFTKNGAQMIPIDV